MTAKELFDLGQEHRRNKRFGEAINAFRAAIDSPDTTPEIISRSLASVELIQEINDLHIEGMPPVESLNALIGAFVNLEYRLPNGTLVKFLDDNVTYLGNQLECEFGGDRCFGIVANMDFILVCTYEENGENPELVIYKKR